MKKNREFDRLAHFLLMQTSSNIMEVVSIKQDIDNDEKVSNKKKRELYSDIIEVDIENKRLIASIMNAAGNSPTFRFSKKDATSLSIEDVADRLDVKIPCYEKKEDYKDEITKNKLKEVGKEIAKKMGLEGSEVHAIKMTPEAAAAMGAMLEAISKKQGDK